MGKSLHRHGCGVGFTLCRVTCDVGCCNEGFCEVLRIDIRLVLPYISNVGQVVALSRCGGHTLSARGVYKGCSRVQQSDIFFVYQMAGCRVKRGVQGYDICALQHLFERYKIKLLALLAWWVGADGAKAPMLGILLYQCADISHTYNAQGAIFGAETLTLGKQCQSRRYPL